MSCGAELGGSYSLNPQSIGGLGIASFVKSGLICHPSGPSYMTVHTIGVKRGQNLEAETEARALRSRPRPMPFFEVEA